MLQLFLKLWSSLFTSRVLNTRSILPQSFLSKASSATSTMAAVSPSQQDGTATAFNPGNLSIANDRKKSHRDNSAGRERSKQDGKWPQFDTAHQYENTQTGGQPSVNTVPISPTPQASLSTIQKRTLPRAANSFASESVISAIHQFHGTIHPAMSAGSDFTQVKSPLASFNPFGPFAIPSPEAQHAQRPKTQLYPPTPSQNYLSLASSSPMLSHTPQRLLLVLDLNGTLLFREVGSTKFIPRPFLWEFLDYCLKNHVILIWSSAKPLNVAAICNQLFTRQQHETLFGVWARNTLGLTPSQYNSKTQVYKRLDLIWDDRRNAIDHPLVQQGRIWSQKNTLLIDDSILKASAQPYNHVEVPEFLRNSKETTADGGNSVFGQVAAYLEEARRSDNVSSFVRERRFRMDQGWAWRWNQAEEVGVGDGAGTRASGWEHWREYTKR